MDTPGLCVGSAEGFLSGLIVLILRAYSVAVADFSAMLEQEPYNSVARTFRGRAYAKMVIYTGHKPFN